MDCFTSSSVSRLNINGLMWIRFLLISSTVLQNPQFGFAFQSCLTVPSCECDRAKHREAGGCQEAEISLAILCCGLGSCEILHLSMPQRWAVATVLLIPKKEETSWVTEVGQPPAHAVTCYSAIHKQIEALCRPNWGLFAWVEGVSCPARPIQPVSPVPLWSHRLRLSSNFQSK